MNSKTLGKTGLLAVQFAGIAASALLILITFVNPDEVETRLQGFAVAKVEEAANTAWDTAAQAAEDSGRAERLGALAERFGLEAALTEERRAQIVPALMAFALSDRCGANCGLAAAGAAVVDTALVERAARFRIGERTVQDFIVERYETTVSGLIADLRQFGLVNLVALSLMAALVLFRNYLNWRFTALSVAVTGYTIWAAQNYVFGQNWALTILFQDWAGPAYQVSMIAVCMVLADWLFLNGFFTKLVGNAISTMLSTFSPG